MGWAPVKDPVHINDFQATLLHLFGLDHLRLTHRFQGRDFRPTDVRGQVINKWLRGKGGVRYFQNVGWVKNQ